MSIRYLLEVEPSAAARVEYAVRLLLDGIGFAGRRVGTADEADLAYASERPHALRPDAVWIRRASVADWERPARALPLRVLLASEEIPFAASSAADLTTRASDDAAALGDVVYATYALVTGALEDGQPRDAWGVPVGSRNPLATTVWRRPLVALYCEWLQAALERSLGELQVAPRWPDGKRYAIVVSHDVDAPFTRRRGRSTVADSRATPRSSPRGPSSEECCKRPRSQH